MKERGGQGKSLGRMAEQKRGEHRSHEGWKGGKKWRGRRGAGGRDREGKGDTNLPARDLR